MVRKDILYRTIVGAAATILAYQLFVPPIVGMADQGDFRRMIGRFGYGPEQHQPVPSYMYVARKYVPDPSYRSPEWEQVSSEYLFVGASFALNRVVSKDGKWDIILMGLIHGASYLVAFMQLLHVTRSSQVRVFLWIAILVVLTDVACVAYFNSFYAEPASLIFFMLLAAESIEMHNSERISLPVLFRWTLWAIMLVLAKPQNAGVGLVAAMFAIHLRTWTGRAAWLSCALIFTSIAISIATAPAEMKNACTYNLVFKAILPESRDPAADLRALGLDSRLQDYSGTGPWSPKTVFLPLTKSGAIGHVVTQRTVLQFYLRRPARLWRHIKAMLPIAMLSRPEYGNFERSAGYAPMARSQSFALWSDCHERVFTPVAKFFVLLLPLPAVTLAVWRRLRTRSLEYFAALCAACLMSFLAAIFGDAWDNVKHLFLFNVMIDACLLAATVLAFSLITSCARWRRHWTASPES